MWSGVARSGLAERSYKTALRGHKENREMMEPNEKNEVQACGLDKTFQRRITLCIRANVRTAMVNTLEQPGGERKSGRGGSWSARSNRVDGG